ncbi:MAG: hypothetical protein V1884_04995 [Candidatus Omnitrophota bacterium]
MRRYFKISVTILFLALGMVSFVFCEEESYTITTYYPSPYGVYNELTTYSNTNLAIQSGNVGIGIESPSKKLEVAGEIKLSGAAPSYKITNVAMPTANNDVAIKAYVDAAGGKAVISLKCSWMGVWSSVGSCSPPGCPSGWTSLGAGCSPSAAWGTNSWYGVYGYCERWCQQQ